MTMRLFLKLYIKILTSRQNAFSHLVFFLISRWSSITWEETRDACWFVAKMHISSRNFVIKRRAGLETGGVNDPLLEGTAEKIDIWPNVSSHICQKHWSQFMLRSAVKKKRSVHQLEWSRDSMIGAMWKDGGSRDSEDRLDPIGSKITGPCFVPTEDADSPAGRDKEGGPGKRTTCGVLEKRRARLR